MISWIQTLLAKNGKVIFSVLLVVLLIPFVFTIGNTPGCAGTERQGEDLSFFGQDFTQRAVAERWAKDANISTLLETGRPPFNEQFIQFTIASRIASLHLADQVNIPAPGPEQIKAYIPTLQMFQTPTGEFDNQAYLEFIDSIDTNPVMTEADVEQVISNSFRISELEKVLGAQGFALPYEARLSQQVKRTTYSVEVAQFNKSNFNPEIAATEEQLEQYYSQNAPTYEVPEKVEAAWVPFRVEELKSEVSIATDDETLTAYLEENRSKYEGSLTDDEDGTTPELTLDLVRTDLLTDYTAEASTREAGRLAEQKASDLAYELYELGAAYGSNAATQFFIEQGLEPIDLAPISATDPAGRLGPNMPQDLPATLHALSAERSFSDAVRLTNGDFAVFLFKGRIPANIPSFEELRSRVTRDFNRAEKERLFSEAGRQISAELQAKVEAGASFKEAVMGSELAKPIDELVDLFLNGRDLLYIAENSGADISVFEDFTSQRRPTDLQLPVLNALPNLEVGDVSPMITSGAIGYFTYVTQKDMPEIAEDDGSLATELEQIESRVASQLGQGVLSALIQEESPAPDEG